LRKIAVELLREIELKKPKRVKIGIELEKIATAENIETLENKGMGKITYKSTLTPYIYMEIDVDKIEEIEKLGFVKKIWHVPTVELLAITEVKPMEAVQITLKESTNYIQADIMHSNNIWGEGINIAIVDSGIDLNHPMFKDAILKAKNFTSSDENDVQDQIHHGTWCASAAAGRYWVSPEGYELQGMAPKAKLIIARIFGSTGSTTMDIAMAGLEWAVKEGAHVASNSWGGSEYQPLHDLIKALVANYDCAIVAAAGNSGPKSKTISYPGGYKEVLCVGALAVKNPEPDSISAFSSRGPSTSDGEEIIKPDVCAPGGNAVRDSQGADECIIGAAVNGTKCWRGTSMATPHVSGALALLREYHKDKDAKFCMEALMSSCLDLCTPGKDNDSGFGRIRTAYGMEYIRRPVYGVSLQVLDKFGNDLAGKSIHEFETITFKGVTERHDGGKKLPVNLYYKLNDTLFLIDSLISNEDGSYSKQWQIPDITQEQAKKIQFLAKVILDADVKSVRAKPSEVYWGDQFTIEVTIENLNQVDLDFDAVVTLVDELGNKYSTYTFLDVLIPANQSKTVEGTLIAPLALKTFDVVVEVMEINQVTYEKLLFKSKVFPKAVKVIMPPYSEVTGVTCFFTTNCPKLCVSGINEYCIDTTSVDPGEINIFHIYKNGVRVNEWTFTHVKINERVYLDNNYFFVEYLEYIPKSGAEPEKARVKLGSRAK
jgi:hypothetical protein